MCNDVVSMRQPARGTYALSLSPSFSWSALGTLVREIDDGSIYIQAPRMGIQHLIRPSKWTREILLAPVKVARFHSATCYREA